MGIVRLDETFPGGPLVRTPTPVAHAFARVARAGEPGAVEDPAPDPAEVVR